MSPIPIVALAACGGADAPGDVPLRRLTPTQYNRTVADLYGYPDAESWPWREEEGEEDVESWPYVFPPEVEVRGFDGFAEGQIASDYLVETLQRSAVHFARFAPDAPHFWACARRDCPVESVVRLAHRAYRRPLTDAERRRVEALYADAAASYGSRTAIQIVAAGLLQTPQFLFRPAPRPGDELDPFALASRMSYLLWDSMPDPALFEAAASGKLRTKRQIRRQADRMLDDPRARAAVVRFHRQWLDLDEVYATRQDLATYLPTYAPQIAALAEEEAEDPELANEAYEELWSGLLVPIRHGMVREAELFVEKTIFEGGGTLRALLTDHHGYVSDVNLGGPWRGSTADIYRPAAYLQGPPVYGAFLDDGNFEFEITWKPVAFDPTQRAGVLTQGAVLAALSHPVHPAPVLRGKFLLERFACLDPGQPPPEAAFAAPPDSPDAAATNRERVEAVTDRDGCRGCHEVLNPLGYALEPFDAMGGWRDEDNGQPVDATGRLRLPGEDDAPAFDGPVQLAHHLAASEVVSRCYVEHWARYAIGRELREADAPAIDDLVAAFARNDGDIRTLLVDIVASDLIRGNR